MRNMTPTTKVKLGLLLVGLVVGVAIPYMVSPFMVGMLTLALILGLLAMSVDLLAGFGGLIPLGHAGIMATAGYAVGYVAVRQDGGYPQQIIAALVVGVLASAVFAAMAMRTRGIYFIMITTAQGMIVWGLALRLSSVTGAENGLRGIIRPPVVGAYWKYYYLCLGIVALSGGLLWVITKSPFGLALRGLRESEERLRAVGYNVALHKFYAFSLSGFFASIAGILFVYRDQFISPAASEFLFSANAILMTILGGIGTLIGPLLGSTIIVLIENVLSSYVERWPTLLGIVFIITILFAQKGLVGLLSQQWNRLLGRRSRSKDQIFADDQVPAPVLDQGED